MLYLQMDVTYLHGHTDLFRKTLLVMHKHFSLPSIPFWVLKFMSHQTQQGLSCPTNQFLSFFKFFETNSSALAMLELAL